MPPRPTRFFAALLLSASLLTACNPESSYDVRGRVAGFGDDGRTVIVEHEDVPGLMPAMTMPFKALRADEVRPLDVGDAVGFVLHVSRDSTWISDLVQLPDDAVARRPAGEPLPPRASSDTPSILLRGDTVPAFSLVDQDGEPLLRQDLVGRTWLVTFIYTRCPLPEYCPLLARRFRQMQPELARRYGDQVQLVSVTIDPEHDTPEVLHAYAERIGADLSTWTFATGSPEQVAAVAEMFGVYSEEAGGTIDHSLTTALIGPDGRVRGIWRGNDWQVEDVLDAVARTAEPLSDERTS